jgi:hypothetical protein
MYCEQIACELDIIASHDVSAGLAFMESGRNKPLYPVNQMSYQELLRRSETKLRRNIREKHRCTFENKLATGKKRSPTGQQHDGGESDDEKGHKHAHGGGIVSIFSVGRKKTGGSSADASHMA